jgi:hypothetical protein
LRFIAANDGGASEEIQVHGIPDNEPGRRTGRNTLLEVIKSFVI